MVFGLYLDSGRNPYRHTKNSKQTKHRNVLEYSQIIPHIPTVNFVSVSGFAWKKNMQKKYVLTLLELHLFFNIFYLQNHN